MRNVTQPRRYALPLETRDIAHGYAKADIADSLEDILENLSGCGRIQIYLVRVNHRVGDLNVSRLATL